MSDDRTVHALHREEQIVRYDRAGKWWIEYDPPRMRPARRVSIREAVRRAIELRDEGGTIFFDQPGGNAFDREVRRQEQA